ADARHPGAAAAGGPRRVHAPGCSRWRGTTGTGRLRRLARPPHAIALPGDVVEAASARDARGKRLGDVVLTGASCDLVPPLDQQPRLVGVPALPAADLHEVPAAVQLAAVEGELEPPFRQALVRIAQGLPGSAVPEQHGAAAVLALRDHALEGAVLDRMVLGPHRETLLGWVEARPLGDRPAQQEPVELETKVVVQPRRGVLLNDERVAPTPGSLAPARLGRHPEITLAPVLAETGGGPAAGDHGRSDESGVRAGHVGVEQRRSRPERALRL